MSTEVQARSIEFAGRSWEVKNSPHMGPGPNRWSDSPKNVWVDDQGHLHLKITHRDGKWYCAEVYTRAATRHGMHRFKIVGRPDLLDKNVVFSPFIYQNDQKEIDIEFSRWGKAGSKYNAQHVVQPAHQTGNKNTFVVSLTGNHSTHSINWQPGSIQFLSFHGHHPEPPTTDFLINEWRYDGKNSPDPGKAKVHINLWLFRGKPPSDGQEVEMVISGVDLPIR